jgi:cytidylate kinase
MSLITISRGMGSGGEAIADIVSHALKLELFDDERLHREAVDMGIKPDEFGSLDEKTPGFWDYLWGLKPELYLNLMESVVYNVAKKGDGVILGHGSQFLLRDFGCALQIFIRASESARIAYLMTQSGMGKNAAKKLIHKSDHERRGFCRFAFHLDWDDPSLYDLVINTDKIGIDGAAKLIIETATSPEIKECGLNALESMEGMALTKRVHAALLRNKFNLATLHVEGDNKGVVNLYGLISTRKGHDLLVETIKEVPGVTEVLSEVTVLPPAVA